MDGNGNPLNREEIRRLILDGNPPLIADYVELDAQLQPNGFDLTVRAAAKFVAPGQLGAADADRVLAGTAPLEFGVAGWLTLPPGAYLLTFNEIVTLPPDLMALGRPRSSLLRCGASLHTAIWDAGYRGRSQSLLAVHHPAGFRLQRATRAAQLAFFRLATPPGAGYGGRYLGEGLPGG